MSRRADSEWVSYHVFYQGSGDRILSGLVLPVVISPGSRIDRFFFLRYGLGGPHIRLRLLCAPEDRGGLDEVFRDAAADFFRRWPSETRLAEEEIRRRNRNYPGEEAADAVYPNNSVVELPFQPEVDRYGGPGLIGPSLDFFCVSSARVLRWIGEHNEEPRPRRLFRALRALLDQALGFASDGGELARLVAYAAPGGHPGLAPLTARADREFERCREDYVALVRETDSSLTAASRALAWRIRDAARPVWWRIVSSQLHMTSNRLGLTKGEEMYLGHILRRAVREADAGPLPRPGLVAGEALAALAMAEIDQLRERANER